MEVELDWPYSEEGPSDHCALALGWTPEGRGKELGKEWWTWSKTHGTQHDEQLKPDSDFQALCTYRHLEN